MSSTGSDGSFDLQTGPTKMTADLYPGDKYIAGRRHNDKKKKEKQRKSTSSSRRSSTANSTTSSSAGGRDGSTKKRHSTTVNSTGTSGRSMSTLGLQDGHSSLNKVTPDNYYDDPSVPTAYASYAESKYVKPPKIQPAVTDGGQGGGAAEQSALLDMPSERFDPDDPLANLPDFQDEYEDEMDVIEMREAKQKNWERFGGGMHDTDKLTPCQKCMRHLKIYCIPILIGLLFLVGLVAGILYFVQLAGDSNSKKQVAQAVAVAPEQLNLLCDQTAADGTTPNAFNVPELCKEACLKAECCWNPNGNYVCTPDTINQCAPYVTECNQWKEALAPSSDHHEVEQVVPTFPAGLATSCVRTAFEISDSCREGCAAADCCWNQTGTILCSEDTIPNCGSFKETCDFLNEHPPDTSTTGISSNKNRPFPDAPDGLDLYCDPTEMDQMKEISLHVCEDKCGLAECCWKTGVASCVSKFPPEACHDYTQACAILNQLSTAPGGTHDTTTETATPASEASNTNNVPVAPSDLAQTCSREKIADNDTGGEALIACEQMCLKASCCWQPNMENPCTENSLCDAYKDSCSIFASLFDKPVNYDPTSKTLPPQLVSNVPQAKSSLSMTCAKDVLKTTVDNGKFIVECEKECLQGACCWKENHPTICPDAPQCAAYAEPCGTNLMDALLSLENGGNIGDAPPAPAPATSPPTTTPPTTPAPQVQTDVPEAASDLEILCSPDVLKLTVSEGQFIVQCQKECLEGACCWKENNPSVCPDAIQCASYMVPCKEHLVPVLKELEGTDHGLPLKGDSDSSSSSGGDTSLAISIPAPPDDINMRCSVENLSQNPDGRYFCQTPCNKAKCCWNSNGATDDCTSNPACADYSSCENLLTTTPAADNSSGNDSTNSNSNAPPSPPDDLQETCSASEIIAMEGLGICRVACAAADCCWRTDSQSCSSAADCATYKKECALMRSELSLSSQSVGGTKDEIASTCDDKLANYDRSSCEELCKPGGCCYTNTACSTTTDCSIYDPCLVLNRRLLRH